MRILRNRKWLILALLLLGAGAGIALALSRSQEYTADASLLISDPTAAVAGGENADRAVATSRELLELPAVARDAARALGGGLSSSEVDDAVSVSGGGDANLLTVEATDDSAEQAARIANQYAKSFIVFRREASQAEVGSALAGVESALEALPESERNGSEARALQERRDELRTAQSAGAAGATLVQSASPPDDASSRHLLRDGLLGALIGLVLGFALAAFLERFDKRLKTIEELEEIYELPVLARVPRSRSFGKRGNRARAEALSKTLGFSEEAEAFRALRANLRYFNVDRPVRSVLVVSPLSGDGKSTVARYLAITMAAMGDRVCLVNADLRKSEDGASTDDGLSLVLAGFELDEALIEMPISFDAVSQESRMLVELPSGPMPPNPGELMESARMRWVVRELEDRYDVVIIDSPALMTVSDALSLVPDVSGLLIVSAFDHTTQRAALDLRKQLELLHGRMLGVVANFWTPQKSAYYYDYGKQPEKAKSGAE